MTLATLADVTSVMQLTSDNIRRTMLRNDYAGQNCSIAATLEVVGERWTMLIMRDALAGICRFEDFQRRLGVAPNILNARLRRLVDAGVMERVPYQDRPPRYEYLLTESGRDFRPVIAALHDWGTAYCPAGRAAAAHPRRNARRASG